MFEQLPETIPQKNKRKLEAFGGAFALQVVLVAGLIILQMAMPEKLGKFQLLTTLHMAPPPPPAAAPPSAPPEPARAESRSVAVSEAVPVVTQPVRPVEKAPEVVVAPTAIPKDIARIVESGAGAGGGVPGGVPGGIRGGIPGGVGGGALGGVLGGAVTAPALPPPTEPVRVGGNVKPPKVVHIEQPQYPPAAKKAHVEGVVIVEATVTANGAVDKVKVVSGPPLLQEAAVEAVSRWKYEPTYLNGQAVPVILTAKISFSLSDAEK
jgi:protein TonB